MSQNNSVKITLIITAGVILITLIALGVYMRQNETKITANGVAEIKAVPDIAVVYFNVETTGTTSQEASDKNSEIIDNLITELVKQGFERKDIQTQNFNVYPDYLWINGQRKENGYRASHSLRIEISASDTGKISNVVDAGISAGAGISYINFELTQEKQNQLKAQALQQATEDARIKAQSIASGLGKTLGRVVSVSSSDFGYYPWLAYDAAGVSSTEVKQVAVNIQPSEQTINAQVSVVFAIR